MRCHRDSKEDRDWRRMSMRRVTGGEGAGFEGNQVPQGSGR